MKKALVILALLFTLCGPGFAAPDLAGKRVLHVNSYHEGLVGSDAEGAGIKEGLKGTGITLKTFYMDTKRNDSEAHAKAAALSAKALIEKYKPHLVIASDDAAAKFLIQPYYKDAALPFVFCGVNWDASVYGFPYNNVTGVKEMELLPQMLKIVKRYAKGERLGFLAADTLSERKNIDYHKKIFGIAYTTGAYVGTFEDWKHKYIELQQQVDVLVILSFHGVDGWNDDVARKFVMDNTRIPSGSLVPWVAPISMVSLSQQLKEQGTRAARMAILILQGKRPIEIPIEENTEGQLILNLPLADKLGITFEHNLLRTGEVIR